MQRVSRRPWFRRRAAGFGWRPASWQGWAITGLAALLVIGTLALGRGSSARIPVVILVVALYTIVALATGGARAASEEAPTPPEEESPVEPPPELPRRKRVRSSAPASPGEPVLVVEQLTKRFGERVAVEEVSFSVGAGEVFGFLGPNGAGKSTTVRMLGTLIAPTSGSALVAGLPLAPVNGVEIRQRIAVMPESPGLYLRLTVTENLEFFAGLYGLGSPRERITRALEAVNLSNRGNDLCGSLSKGLRQRVGLARALLGDPTILFLDEPTSGLDPLATREVNELVDRLRDRGVTVFLTTHRLEEAEQVCDRVAILNTRLLTIGQPDELRDRLFAKGLLVKTGAPLGAPGRVFAGLPGVEDWRSDDEAVYELRVSDARLAAPALARALVAAGADVLSLTEERHSLEDVYLELVEDDVEARR
jgi:ABC-2 type transport system ATP-binding protein